MDTPDPTVETDLRVAILGLGPRGLGALEALVASAAERGVALSIDCFDPAALPGAGPNFSPSQTDLCLLNTPLRDIDVAPPDTAATAFPGFADWLAAEDLDVFPSRARLGSYLGDRFRKLRARARSGAAITVGREAITGVKRQDGRWRLSAQNKDLGLYDEVVLTLGQPATSPDTQLARWRRHARQTGAALSNAYPDTALLDAAQDWAGQRVAIRGLGLTTFDVLRVLTIGLGGRFENNRYTPSGREPERIIPFSLNGRPPAPKPATRAIDQGFEPLDVETRVFELALARAEGAAGKEALDPILDALNLAASRIARDLGAAVGEPEIRDWLTVEKDDPSAHEELPPLTLLHREIEMAEGAAAPSAGFIVGQVWRKWQNALRRGFNSADLTLDARRALIGFDEGLKRYSYGPPVGSARQLSMLIDAGLVHLRIADDPDIGLTHGGWRLVEGDHATEVSAMIDGVLPSPSLDGLQSDLIDDLRRAGRLTAMGDGLGARTTPDGRLIGADGAPQPGLSLLGRLALGSVIAVDSIHDCFGAASRRWAEGVMARRQTRAAA